MSARTEAPGPGKADGPPHSADGPRHPQVRLTRNRPGLWLVDVSLGDFDVRGAVAVGATGTLVWDTLSHPADMGRVVPLVYGRLTVAYSHADWDHVWGTGGLSGVTDVVAHAACGARFADDVPQTLIAMRRTQPGQWDEVELVAPTIAFRDTLALDLGGVTVRLHHLPGHTPDSIVAFIPEWQTLLAGDAAELPLPTVQDMEGVPAWLAGLEAWARDARVGVVVPGHGPIGGREVLTGTAEYLRGLLAGRAATPGNLSPFYRDVHAANVRLALG